MNKSTPRLKRLAEAGAGLGVVGRGIVMMMTPGGRHLLAVEAEVEQTRLTAQALGIPVERADELLAELAAAATTLLSIPDVGREARRRLACEALNDDAPSARPHVH